MLAGVPIHLRSGAGTGIFPYPVIGAHFRRNLVNGGARNLRPIHRSFSPGFLRDSAHRPLLIIAAALLIGPLSGQRTNVDIFQQGCRPLFVPYTQGHAAANPLSPQHQALVLYNVRRSFFPVPPRPHCLTMGKEPRAPTPSVGRWLLASYFVRLRPFSAARSFAKSTSAISARPAVQRSQR